MLPSLLLLLTLSQAEPASPTTSQSQLPIVTDDYHPNEPAMVRLGYDRDFLALFDEASISYTGGGYQDKEFRYRLFIPETAGPDDTRPLVVWLHGMSTSGDDNFTQLRHLSTLVFQKPWQRERYPFFLLAVQCPHDNRAWTGAKEDADDMVDVLAAILDKTLQEHPIDADRVSLTGVSSGGSGCWQMALLRPELFSCVAPISSRGADHSQIHCLLKIPIWAFHSSEDSGSPIAAPRATVEALQAAGGMAHLTEVDMRGHNCWNEAFLDYDLLPWLLSQKRGQPPAEPIGKLSLSSHVRAAWRSWTRNWSATQALAQAAIPLVLVIAIWSARRNRRRKAASALATESA